MWFQVQPTGIHILFGGAFCEVYTGYRDGIFPVNLYVAGLSPLALPAFQLHAYSREQALVDDESQRRVPGARMPHCFGR